MLLLGGNFKMKFINKDIINFIILFTCISNKKENIINDINDYQIILELHKLNKNN